MEEKQILEQIAEASQTAFNTGWAKTKEAIAETNPVKKTYLEAEAVTFYCQALEYIKGISDEDITPKIQTEIGKEVIRSGINVFDTQRRVGKTEEAIVAGKKTLENAVKFNDPELINRAGNLLSLVVSNQAHKLIQTGNIDEAIAKYKEANEAYEKMDLKAADDKLAVMVYINKAANHLNIYQFTQDSKRTSESNPDLNAAMRALNHAPERLNNVDDNEFEAVWNSNLNANFGHLALHRKKFGRAKRSYILAVEHTHGNKKYKLQTAVMQTFLAHTLCTHFKKDMETARQQYSQIQEYLDSGKDFGIYNFRCMHLIEEIKETLKTYDQKKS